MTKVLKHSKWFLPVLFMMALALFFTALPAYAAEVGVEDTEGDTQASVNFTAGKLQLVSAPTLDFGSHDITPDEAVYTAESVTPVTQVSDLRGSGKGWDLMVSLSPSPPLPLTAKAGPPCRRPPSTSRTPRWKP